MQDLCETVALKYGGSLKAEHGTGRNVAPFVEMEWGTKAYELMWEVTPTTTLTLTLTLPPDPNPNPRPQPQPQPQPQPHPQPQP
jgi:D-lactate dehydrogenase